MLSINQNGIMTKWVDGQGSKKLKLEEVEEKELLFVIASKLHSIRGMMVFFTLIIVIGLIGLIASLLSIK